MSFLVRRRFLNIRPAAQAGELSEMLRACGAEVVELPGLSILLKSSLPEFSEALNGRDWLIITSPNGALALAQARSEFLTSTGVRIAALAQATANALTNERFEVDFVGQRGSAGEFAEEFLKENSVPGSVVLLRGSGASEELPRRLREAGWDVQNVVGYDSEPPEMNEAIRLLLTNFQSNGNEATVPEGIFVGSGMTVTNFVLILRHSGHWTEPSNDWSDIPLFCIGSKTAAVATSHGFRKVYISSSPTASSLLECAENYFTRR